MSVALKRSRLSETNAWKEHETPAKCLDVPVGTGVGIRNFRLRDTH